MSKKISRRDVLKALVTIPVLGYFSNRFYVKYTTDLINKTNAQPEFLKPIASSIRIPSTSYLHTSSNKIRLGIVGNGMRGPQIFRALGFADKQWAKKNKDTQLLNSFLNQSNLNVEITGVCDTFSLRAEKAAQIVTSPYRSGNAPSSKPPIIYKNYREMLSDNNLDAIVILTPDHWHAEMAIDAAQAGKHIYIEKPMCQTAEEAKKLRDVVKRTGVILQVGHQNRQQASYIKAREIIDYGILGNISRIKTFTNRNSAWGAWIREIPPKANSHNINWKEFLGNKQWRKFDLDRYFNWQKWFEYGTGPAGNQFSHSYDCVNQILNLGIPDNVVVSGGNYYYKDPRDIPDVMNAVYNYPDRKCTLTYDCTLQNSRENDITFLGKDATMEVAKDLAVYSDRQSQKYNKYTKSDKEPMFTFHPKINRINAETSATSRYYHERGFGYTYHNGERIDVTYLHMKEWLYCIRNNKQPSCNVKRGFDETVTVDMTNKAYLNENMVKWSKEKETIL